MKLHLALFSLVLSAVTVVAMPKDIAETLALRDAVDEVDDLAPVTDGLDQSKVEDDTDDFELSKKKKKKKKKNPCKRGCYTSWDCCHNDMCYLGICMGPQKPPRV
ncbi:hypothetical protein P175DRAFT_0499609 [Aspergillus ochraceoroseus IBT 24754]|uniref:Uncharacterized protein n=1 Tax=Aspergillus ochraceoroseus IBT 24754 TaxID=1392256 RepID=A0A2T5M3E9_9EURO|nr:uncharacterized protein P175DRAFT_0499609 [Aspergillus ochraceoroseus IBT 24754]PTU23053.1 hypothetical protein P175DRAFT_0499609 [Aspergillus ochraceoroseus IBT 24754]